MLDDKKVQVIDYTIVNGNVVNGRYSVKSKAHNELDLALDLY